MTGRQEYDRTKDRQRILGKYMIEDVRRPLVIYDFAPDPSEFPNICGKFSFLFYQCGTLRHPLSLSISISVVCVQQGATKRYRLS